MITMPICPCFLSSVLRGLIALECLLHFSGHDCLSGVSQSDRAVFDVKSNSSSTCTFNANALQSIAWNLKMS